MRVLREKIGIEPIFFVLSLILVLLTIIVNVYGVTTLEISVLITQIAMLTVGVSFLYKGNWKTTLGNMRIYLDVKNIFVYTVIGIIAIILYLLVLSIILEKVGIEDYAKIIEKVELFTPLIIITAITLGPIVEEIFFRAFLTNRVGVVFSSALFALAHISYGSIAEIIGAFGIGVILALILKKSNNLLPCILVHALYNLSALVMFWWFS